MGRTGKMLKGLDDVAKAFRRNAPYWMDVHARVRYCYETDEALKQRKRLYFTEVILHYGMVKLRKVLIYGDLRYCYPSWMAKGEVKEALLTWEAAYEEL